MGPIDVRVDNDVVPLGGMKPRSVLAVLLLHANEPVSSERLALALWGDEVAGEAVKTVRVHMSRLRRALRDPDVVVTTPAGYRLRVRPGELDADVFEDFVEQARTALSCARYEDASTLLGEALSLWRGSPLADFADEPFAAGEIARLQDQRLAAVQNRIAADLECGRHEMLAAELRRLVSEHPTREQLVGLLMLALYRCGRQAEALDVYTQARRALVSELGVEPGPELHRLQAAILNHDESLQPSRSTIPSPSPAPHAETAYRHEGPVVCPFKGLAFFDVADASYFFGREQLVRRLADRVADARLLGIVGPSGCGKSSLARAGLLSALAGGAVLGSERWSQVLLRPGARPASELARALLVDGDQRVVVLVDQFEEIFTVCDDESERVEFVKLLIGAANDRNGRFTIVLTLRADFYGRCAAYAELAEMLAASHLLVGSMRSDELKQAIEGPSRHVGLQLDDDLTEALLRDVEAQPGALPLLSATLLELWQHRDGRRLTRAAYDRGGGVRGSVSRLAEQAFGQLDVDSQRTARGVLLRLVGEGQDSHVERRRVPLAEFQALPNKDIASILALLVDRRLLTVGGGAVELAHEALLREWPRLRAWIEENRDGLRIHRSLSAAAREWEKFGCDFGALYRGARLAEAVEWAGEDLTATSTSELERAFLAASEERQRSEEAAKQRRTRRAIAGLAGALVIVSALAFIAVFQRGQATEQRDIAQAERLATNAVAQLTTDPGQALTLGMQATRRSARP